MANESSWRPEVEIGRGLVVLCEASGIGDTQKVSDGGTCGSKHDAMAIVLLGGVCIDQSEIGEAIVEVKSTKFLVI